MKTTKYLLNAILAIGMITASGNIKAQTTPSMIIGGIEVKGFSFDRDVLRTIIYKSLVNSKMYVVNDRYDVAEKIGADKLQSCMGKECLTNVGKQINADFAISAAYDGLGDRILISIKIVDIKTGTIVKNEIGQFENQVDEINRMTDIMIYRILGIPIDENIDKMLSYKDNPAASSGPGKMNNSGPRIGFGAVFGENADYFTRSENEGGRGNIPFIFNIGYQLEAQYVGTENFSGLFEFVFNIGGLDQGIAIPSLAILHGARFGKNSWEIALGPSLSVKPLSELTLYKERLTTKAELTEKGITDFSEMTFNMLPDTRGAYYFSTNFVIGVGRTFHSGAINIPVNAYVSLNKYGAGAGMSMGMNIGKKQTKIHEKKNWE